MTDETKRKRSPSKPKGQRVAAQCGGLGLDDIDVFVDTFKANHPRLFKFVLDVMNEKAK